MLKPCPSPWFYASQFLLVIALLAFACYLEWVEGLLPCALCELQRVVFALLGLIFVVGIFLPQKKWPQILINLLLSFLALLGLAFAGRQVWLQYWPPDYTGGSCDASLTYLLKIMPLQDVLATVLMGGPECAKVNWQFLHLSIAGWALLWFAAFLLLALAQMLGWIFSRK